MEQNNLSADDMILFASIVEQRGLARAAEHLGMPKATVSRRLANLESALGQRLLLRTTRRLALTEYGQEFLDHCRRVSEEVGNLHDFVHSRELAPRGHLRVSMPGDYARQHCSRAIATFIETYPEIELDLDLGARRVDLLGERFDLAIRMGTLEDDATLVARKIDDQRFELYASPIYLALHPAPRHPDDLAHHVAVRLLAANGSAVPWHLTRGKDVWEGIPPGRLSLNSPDMIQQLLLDGAGIGALPESFVSDDVRQKRLVRVLSKWTLPSVPAWAVMPMRRYPPYKTRVFLEHLEKFMQKG
ncbi:LysR family transcriptional regulator [Ferrigenium sp. UT5]|uniref:LysR family transcriptional regulator n=1 Tax=Ferrigenium sp. UT5 TaxID=3242105 RepID=UPI003553D2C2